MPLDRRRSDMPEDSEFQSPRVKAIYLDTELLLDEAPPIGELELKYLYDSWINIRKKALQGGDNEKEAEEYAWMALAGFVSERSFDVSAALEIDPGFMETVITEIIVCSEWFGTLMNHFDEQANAFKGRPFFSESPHPAHLYNHKADELVSLEFKQPIIFGHLQLLGKTAELQEISPEISEAVLAYSQRDMSKLRDRIGVWNELMEKVEADGPEKHQDMLKAEHRILVLQLVTTWGEDGSINLDVLNMCFAEFVGEKPEWFGLDSVHKIEKEYEETGKDYYSEVIILPHVIDYIHRGVEYARQTNTKGYVAELDNFKGLNFGVIVTFDNETNMHIGTLLVSQVGREAPRKRSKAFAVEAENVQEAVDETVRILLENPDERVLPEGTKLNTKNYKAALRRLSYVDAV